MTTQEEPKAERYGAQEKCRAVLAVWVERKKASVLCREMGVSATLLWQWQDRALSGMLVALEPKGGREGSAMGPALAPQVRRLLERKVREREGRSLGRVPLPRPRERGKKAVEPAAVA